MSKLIYGVAISCVLGFLLLFPAEALIASRTGLYLWFDTLLPTLLPFMILSNFLIRAGLINGGVAVIAPLFKRLLRLSPAGTYALFIGFFCGYPMGAKVLADLYNAKGISKEEAEYLLGFCNNISPSFIITFLVTSQLKDGRFLVPTLLILYGAPIIWGLLQNPFFRRKARVYPDVSVPLGRPGAKLSFTLVDTCIMDGVTTIVKLGGYVMLFAIISGIIAVLPLHNGELQAVLIAVTEITNGIPAVISQMPYPAAYFVLMVTCSFGGLSSLAQTNSVIKSAHLSLGKYVRSKLMISIITAILTSFFI